MDCQATISRIVPSETERTTGALGNETIERASRSFRIDGALIIEDIVDAAIIVEARRAFREAYFQYLDASEHEDALRVGDRRLIVTINMEPPFDDPRLFANPYLLPVLSAALTMTSFSAPSASYARCPQRRHSTVIVTAEVYFRVQVWTGCYLRQRLLSESHFSK